MIDLREIDETIDELKRHGNSIQAAERLAMLYIARDYMIKENSAQMHEYAQAAAPESMDITPAIISTKRTSEFLAACDGAPLEWVLDVLDEHMEAIRILYPKEYDAIVRAIEEKKGG